MKTHSKITILIIVCGLALASCGDGNGSTQLRSQPARPVLKAYQVHRVTLAQPRQVTMENGETQEVRAAYLIMLSMDPPPFRGPILNVFLGDYRVPEYGGWDDGIYFKVYDRALLDRLDGQPFAYSVDGQPTRTLGMSFKVPDVDAMKTRPERELLAPRQDSSGD